MQPRILLPAVTILCAGVLLTACGTAALHRQAAAGAAAFADEGYLRARNLHLERRYDEAIAAYQSVLAADPNHVNARNGLAIVYAERRAFDQAIPIWRALTGGATMASGPGMGFLFANLGYAYFLQGDYDDAQVALEKACLLDPLDPRAWQYLGETLQKLGQDERARQMLRQAASLREHDLRADYAAVERGARVPAIDKAVQAAARPDEDWALVEVVGTPGGLLELRRSQPPKTSLRTAPVDAPETAPAAVTPNAVAAVEISNGNGRAGLARQMARTMRDPGVKVVRLTNAKGYGVRQTRVEYHGDFREVAERLASRFGAGKPVDASLAAQINVRIVIGRDLSQPKPALTTVSLSQQ